MENLDIHQKKRWYDAALWGGWAVIVAMILAFLMPGSYEPYRIPKERIPEALREISGNSPRYPLTPQEQQAAQKILAEHKVGAPEIQDVLRYAKSGWYWYLLTPLLIWLARYKIKKVEFSVLDLLLNFFPCLITLSLAVIYI